MPDDEKFSSDRSVRVQFSAWTHNYYFYKSIGTQIQVRKRGRSSFLGVISWSSWKSARASSVTIDNTYSGQPGPFSRRLVASNVGDLECKEYAAGVGVQVSPSSDFGPVRPGAVLDLRRVDGAATVVLPNGEMISLSATAGSGPPP
ncbi:MAG: hypothetical protein NVSMB51_01200 [Solirubrobacteraceae bacterium]